MYTCPDICFVVRLVRPFQSNSGHAHEKAVKRILHYLHETMDYILCNQRGDTRLCDSCDANLDSNLMSINLSHNMLSN